MENNTIKQKLKLPLTDRQKKEAMMRALHYSINTTLQMLQAQYNVRITGVTLSERTGDLSSVHFDWEETAEGIKSTEQVKQEQEEAQTRQLRATLAKLNEKQQGNG